MDTQQCPNPAACRQSGYHHGYRGLMSMSPRCSDWSDGWREGHEAKKAEES